MTQAEAELLLALDKTAACEDVNRRLREWIEFIAVLEYHTGTNYPSSTRLLQHDERPPHLQWMVAKRCFGQRIPKEIITEYEHRLRNERHEEVRRRRQEESDRSEHMKDRRPYFHDPCRLAFDPRKVKHDAKEHEGVALHRVWRDPMARTLWLAMRPCHLTSQYFRGACTTQAKWIRKRPPRTVDDLHVATEIGGLSGGCPYWFRVQLYPYIVRVLIDEGTWPYFTPPGVPAQPLRWVVEIPS